MNKKFLLVFSQVVSLFLLNFAHADDQASFADLWSGRAKFGTPTSDYGSGFGMHFLSSVWKDDQLFSYYLTSKTIQDGLGGEVSLFSTKLALSMDGRDFSDYGTVLGVGGSWDYSFAANGQLLHNGVGRLDSTCSGWSAKVQNDIPGFLAYGPYVRGVRLGPLTAQFALTIDQVAGANDIVATIEVYDANLGTFLAQRALKRWDFAGAAKETIFDLPFSNSSSNSNLEFRTYYHDKAAICLRAVGVSIGQVPYGDGEIASFPGVWYDAPSKKWYMVYEGKALGGSGGNDIRLAESVNGFDWYRYPNPILSPSGSWQSVNIGTPNLWKIDKTWYLFYHGYNNQTLQVGVATGTDLFKLTRYNNNKPILANGTSWDAGTIGRRSIMRQGAFYYMAYEGSTLRPNGNTGKWDFANWGSGLARSLDLVNWERFPGNPVVGPTTTLVRNSLMGNDGPELIQTPDRQRHIYYRLEGGLTNRVSLIYKTNGRIARTERNVSGGRNSDLIVWRPDIGYWFVKTGESGFSQLKSNQFGLPGDVPITADLDTDGLEDKIVWRPSSGTWYYTLSSDNSARVITKQWGLSGDTPLVADYDGNGSLDFIVRRNANWYVLTQPVGGGGGNSESKVLTLGNGSQVALAGDFDGDKKSNLATWDKSNGNWYILKANGTVQTIQWGLPGDIPMSFDMNGDGRSEISVWRPSNGTWYIRDTATNGTTTIQWGLSNDQPVVGDFDGDGVLDLAVWRPNSGANWYVRYSNRTSAATVQLGLPSDKLTQSF